MGAHDAIRGFEYQFLWTLEYGLSALLVDNPASTAIQVEGVLTTRLQADQDIVDFGVRCGDRITTVAQIKSGGANSAFTASNLLSIAVRLLTHSAEHYLVVTNRSAGDNLSELLALLRDERPDLRERVLALAGRWKVATELAAQEPEFWQRLVRMEVVLDPRDIEQVRVDVQERVRAARHRVAPSTVGWDAAGLLTGYLVWEVMGKAAGPAVAELPMSALVRILGTSVEALTALIRERDWAIPVTPAPRTGDIARPELLADLRQHLPFPVHPNAAPVCLLAGLSGTGKSSLAVAWADDNAYSYELVMFVDATSPSQLAASFSEVADWFRAHGLIDNDDADLSLRQRIFGVLARSARPWLLVFDNCADQAVVRDWIPPRGYGHTLVTTTDQTPLAGPSTAKIEVAGMTGGEAVELLARRVLGSRTPDPQELEALEELADLLHRWPLALELAAAYLVSTVLEYQGDLARAIAGFGSLLQRAMDDAPSVPHGYPHTVVGTITATWQRITSRAEPPAVLAAQALRGAAFVASRQIPVHLLLASASPEVHTAFPHYAESDPPIGEVLRAMKRDSLAVMDEHFPMPAEAIHGLSGLSNASITMNDIVQFIVRGLVDREGNTSFTVFKLAFCTQAWLQTFTSRHEMGTAAAMVAHAITLSERTIELADFNQAVSLLWGNTAGILGYLEEWQTAKRYLAAELDYLDSQSDDHSLGLRVQTLVSYAHALYELSDHPRDNVEHIVPLLEQFVTQVPQVVGLDQETAALTIRMAGATVMNLLMHGVEHPRLTALESALRDFRRLVPATGGDDWFENLTGLTLLIRTGRTAEARAQGEAMLKRMHPAQVEYPQVLRIVAEACVHLGDWDAAKAIVDEFEQDIQSGTLRRFDTSTLLRNLSTGCVEGLLNQDKAAFELLASVGRMATAALDKGVKLQAGDRDVIMVFRALSCYLNGDKLKCRSLLDQAVPAEIEAVDRTGSVNVMRRLLLNGCTDRHDPPFGTSFELPSESSEGTLGRRRGVATPDTVLTPNENAIRNSLISIGADSAPARAVGAAQVTRAAGHAPRDPLEVAVETAFALRAMGLSADIAEFILFVFLDDGTLAFDEPMKMAAADPRKVCTYRGPHQVAWLRSPGQLVDPVVPQLPAVRTIATDHEMHRHPVVVPIGTDMDVPILRLGGLAIAYHTLGAYGLHDVAKTLPSDRLQACEANAIFVAYQALILLSTTGSDFIVQTEETHPALAGLILRPERLLAAQHGGWR
ncbi:MAG: hypothetical protein WBA97_38275 [Actinophytocola sp.]|uniref:hypothetical protein n=1 Tax=Actinophytocola sp. TaxID=1872138 RepID=UPI003C74B67E